LSPIRYRYRPIVKPTSRVPIRYRYRYIDIGDISTYLYHPQHWCPIMFSPPLKNFLLPMKFMPAAGALLMASMRHTCYSVIMWTNCTLFTFSGVLQPFWRFVNKCHCTTPTHQRRLHAYKVGTATDRSVAGAEAKAREWRRRRRRPTGWGFGRSIPSPADRLVGDLGHSLSLAIFRIFNLLFHLVLSLFVCLSLNL